MSIGINLRVTGHTSIGGRKYQEDFFSVAYQQTENDQSLEYAFFGIYDGHGGAEASLYAREHLMNTIVSQKLFWSENDEDVLKAIRDGYIQTHYSMWREQDKWPKTSSGLPSTAGTTASIAFIRRGKIYIGHVGDSGIVLGYQKDKETHHTGESCTWNAMPLTEDHKPEAYAEKMRIMSCGGKVVTKSGVPRVVWNRPRIGHKGPVRRSTPIDEIPFLAVARSLGDLWSYNSAVDEFIVSPNPDVSVVEIDPKRYRCLIFGTDGLWNVLSPKHAVEIVHAAEMENIRIALEGGCDWKNPSKLLVNEALERWSKSNMKADNTSVVIIMLDPPGPPKRDVLRSMRTSIQHIDHPITNTQALDKLNVTLYDHTTRELVDLSQVTCQDAAQVSQANVQPHQQQQYMDSTPSASYQDMAYTDSFAESYNSFLNTSLSNDHSYTSYTPSAQHYSVHHHHHHHQQQHHHHLQQHNVLHEENLPYPAEGHERSQQDSAEETYLLTNLQTKSERLQSEMMEASTSTASTSAARYSHMECTGNVAIIENFHDYQSPHLPSHSGGHQPPFSTHYPHHSFHHHQHLHHDHPTYQMERFDYHHSPHPQHEPAGCSYSSQHYTAHDLSEHNYPKDTEEYLYPEEDLDNIRQPADTIQETVAVVESTINNSEPDTEEPVVPESIDERPSVISASKADSKSDVEDIQINEISSSNLSALSPAQEASLQSDSDSCLSGDEAKASSSTARSSSSTMDRRSSARVVKAKGKGVRKTIKNIVKIVYETRSSQRPHRTRAQQENLSTTAVSRTMRGKFHSKVKKFLSFKKVKKPTRYSLADVNSGTVSNNNNSINNNNIDIDKSSIGRGEVEKPEEKKRVLRSADQVKVVVGKQLSQRSSSRRLVESIAVISSTSHHQSGAPKRPVALVSTERKLPKRKMLLRKVALDAKRVKRH